MANTDIFISSFPICILCMSLSCFMEPHGDLRGRGQAFLPYAPVCPGFERKHSGFHREGSWEGCGPRRVFTRNPLRPISLTPFTMSGC